MDVLRGLAILAVVIVHVRYVFPDLPRAIRHIAGLGRYGVDLFFIVSAFTLIRTVGRLTPGKFLLRRWLRIAPAYYFGIVLYTGILQPSWSGPVSGAGEVVADLFFLNAWIPGASSNVVPGGWSISTEVAFYALLPYFSAFVISLRRAIVSFVITLVVCIAALDLVTTAMVPYWTHEEIADFRTHCPLGHLATFSLGIVLYQILPRLESLPAIRRKIIGPILIVAGLTLLAVFNTSGFPDVLPRPILAGIPLFLVSAGFALIWSRRSPVVLKPIAWIGVISYSIYLVHFCVLDLSAWLAIAMLPLGAPGSTIFGVTVALTLGASIGCAYVMHQLIERPPLRLLARKAPYSRP